MTQWWRDAVVYQVYPRSFADADGDGLGDLRGITRHLDHLAWLGVDALWIGPCFASPQVDHGYDVSDYRAIDPLFGDLADLDALVETAHTHGLRVLLDLVPNHTSDQHPWFAAAVAAGRGSPERQRYLFRDGRGPGGAEPPTRWRSVFGGSSWTRVTEPDGSPGQWYYHLFAAEQPDLDWRNPAVLAEFESVLRFWLDRGVDGFRIDVSDALIKDDRWPDTPDGSPVILKDDTSPVHAIYRALRRVLDAYPGDRIAVVETGAPDDVVALFVRPDEMHLAFGFRFLHAGFDGARLRAAIEQTLAANALVGAPSTWVTDNHDTPRSVSRLGRGDVLAGAYLPGTVAGSSSAGAAADLATGTRRARALALLLLALPGAAFVYNGQELGLPNVDDLPDDALQDPVWRRSGGTERGRDGCRIPLPWSGARPPYGFSPPGTASWLPVPSDWAGLTVEAQRADPGSMLHLYRAALALRRSTPALGRGSLTWVPTPDDRLLALDLRDGDDRVRVVLNLSPADVPLPPGEVLLASTPVAGHRLAPSSAAWVRLGPP
ncbi:MAG TPA: glycoside hydrolase family 13 protein [Actinotalea sp.]|nr:glycoside hydrolase family 13 protein [Actinotalea sp.]